MIILIVLVALMPLFTALNLEKSLRCPREKLGYNCRRGSGVPCECEKKP